MKKRFLFFWLVFSTFITCAAQGDGTEAVRKFGSILREWSKSNEYELLEDAAKVCAGEEGVRGRGCLVFDSLMIEFERQKNRPIDIRSYRIPHYLQGFQSAMDLGDGISVQILDIKPASNVVFDEESMNDEKRNSLYYVWCNVKVSGSMNYNSKDLFCVRKGSGLISQIRPGEGPVNTSRLADWNHIAAGEFNSIEVSYGYSQNFPLNVGISASISYLNIGLEFGKNFENVSLLSKEHTNFATSSLGGKMEYYMFSPGVFLRYATLSCGLGVTKTKYSYESVYDSYNEKEYFFSIKPKASFNIPVPFNFKTREELFYICPYVGYLIAPKCSKVNCLEAGLGLRFRLTH